MNIINFQDILNNLINKRFELLSLLKITFYFKLIDRIFPINNKQRLFIGNKFCKVGIRKCAITKIRRWW